MKRPLKAAKKNERFILTKERETVSNHSVDTLLEKVVQQEKELIFHQFTNDQALQIGTAIINEAKVRENPLQ